MKITFFYPDLEKSMFKFYNNNELPIIEDNNFPWYFRHFVLISISKKNKIILQCKAFSYDPNTRPKPCNMKFNLLINDLDNSFNCLEEHVKSHVDILNQSMLKKRRIFFTKLDSEKKKFVQNLLCDWSLKTGVLYSQINHPSFNKILQLFDPELTISSEKSFFRPLKNIFLQNFNSVCRFSNLQNKTKSNQIKSELLLSNKLNLIIDERMSNFQFNHLLISCQYEMNGLLQRRLLSAIPFDFELSYEGIAMLIKNTLKIFEIDPKRLQSIICVDKKFSMKLSTIFNITGQYCLSNLLDSVLNISFMTADEQLLKLFKKMSKTIKICKLNKIKSSIDFLHSIYSQIDPLSFEIYEPEIETYILSKSNSFLDSQIKQDSSDEKKITNVHPKIKWINFLKTIRIFLDFKDSEVFSQLEITFFEEIDWKRLLWVDKIISSFEDFRSIISQQEPIIGTIIAESLGFYAQIENIIFEMRNNEVATYHQFILQFCLHIREYLLDYILEDFNNLEILSTAIHPQFARYEFLNTVFLIHRDLLCPEDLNRRMRVISKFENYRKKGIQLLVETLENKEPKKVSEIKNISNSIQKMPPKRLSYYSNVSTKESSSENIYNSFLLSLSSIQLGDLNFDPFEWSFLNESSYPAICKMIREIHSIPTIVTSFENSYSSLVKVKNVEHLSTKNISRAIFIIQNEKLKNYKNDLQNVSKEEIDPKNSKSNYKLNRYIFDRICERYNFFEECQSQESNKKQKTSETSLNKKAKDSKSNYIDLFHKDRKEDLKKDLKLSNKKLLRKIPVLMRFLLKNSKIRILNSLNTNIEPTKGTYYYFTCNNFKQRGIINPQLVSSVKKALKLKKDIKINWMWHKNQSSGFYRIESEEFANLDTELLKKIYLEDFTG